MKHSFRDGFIEELKAYSRKLQAFNVRLSTNFMMDIDHKEARRIVLEIISPLFNGAEKAILYNDGDNDYFGSVLNKIAKRTRNHYELAMDRDLFADEFIEFWSSKEKTRSSVLWVNELSNVDMSKFFEAVKDPYVLGNMGALLPKGAISLARKLTKENGNKVVFCLSSGSGIESLFIFMSPDNIGDYAAAAIENCILTESFLIRYGTGDQ